jgi:hypothetical protein
MIELFSGVSVSGAVVEIRRLHLLTGVESICSIGELSRSAADANRERRTGNRTHPSRSDIPQIGDADYSAATFGFDEFFFPGKHSPLKGSILFVRFWWKQKLKPEITQEIGLVAAGGFQAASGHEQEDHRTMNFIAKPKVDGGLAL